MQERIVKLNVETNVDQVSAEFEKTAKSVKDAEKSLEGLNAQANDLGKKSVKATQKMSRAMTKVKEESSLAEQNLKTMGASLDGVGTGFETAEGAMSLFGAESEALEETMKKTQEAMRLTKTIGELKGAGTAFKNFGKTAISSLKAMKGAIGATGIGLLVIAVASIAMYWDDIAAAMGGAAAEGQKNLDMSIEQAELQSQKYDDSVKYENILRAQGKSEKFIRDLQMEELRLAIEKAEVAVTNAKEQKRLAIQSTKFNEQVLRGILTLMLAPIELLIKAYNKIAKYVPGLKQMGSLAGSISSYFFDATETAKEADVAIADAEKNLNDLKLKQANIQLKDKAERSSRYKAQQKQEKDHQAKLDKEKQKGIEANKKAWEEYMALIEQADEEEFQRKLTDRQRDEKEVEKYYFNLRGQAEAHLETLDKNDKDYLMKKQMLEEQIVNLDRQEKAQLKTIDDEYKAEALKSAGTQEQALYDLKLFLMDEGQAKEIQMLEDSYAEKFALAKNNTEMTLALEEKLAKDKKKIDRKYNEAKAQVAIDAISLIADIAESFAGDDVKRQKKAFQIKKVADIAQATMDGYKAVLSTYANTPGGPVIKGIAAAVSGAFAGLQIANIARKKFDDGGDGGLDNVTPPGDAGGGAVTPEFNIVGDSGINDLESLGAPPVQAYVTSQDVTTAQGLDRARVQNATL